MKYKHKLSCTSDQILQGKKYYSVQCMNLPTDGTGHQKLDLILPVSFRYRGTTQNSNTLRDFYSQFLYLPMDPVPSKKKSSVSLYFRSTILFTYQKWVLNDKGIHLNFLQTFFTLLLKNVYCTCTNKWTLQSKKASFFMFQVGITFFSLYHNRATISRS